MVYIRCLPVFVWTAPMRACIFPLIYFNFSIEMEKKKRKELKEQTTFHISIFIHQIP